jgi:hypothetical protein
MNGARARLYAAVFGWGIVALGVWLWMTCYAFETYEPADNFRSASWPANSRLSLADNRRTLLFFIHPRCPCTRASLTELEKLLTGQTLKDGQWPKVIVVAVIPPQASTEWRNSDTIERARNLPNATLFWDRGGHEAKLFGAVASGTVMLYGQEGSRTFAGGVTAMRGHEGENVGSAHLYTALTQSHGQPLELTPAFGCRLWVGESEEDSACKRDQCSPSSSLKNGSGSEQQPRQYARNGSVSVPVPNLQQTDRGPGGGNR